MAIQKDLNKPVETPNGEVKPESEVMTMNVPAEMMEETPSTEVENKAPLDEDSKVDEPSREDVKTVSNEEWTDEDQKHLSQRAQNRIRDLNEKAKKADELAEEIKSLRSSKQKERFTGSYEEAIKQPLFDPAFPKNSPSLGEMKPQGDTTQLPWDINPQENNFEEKVLTPEEYQKDVYSTADILVQARLAQYQKQVEIQKDLEKIEVKYPELNPDSEDYSNEVSTKIAELFEVQLKSNPNAKLATFVDSIMSLRESKSKEVEKKVQESFSVRTLEQKAEEAITPHEIEPTPEKPYEKMTIEEKESYLKDKGLWN